MFGGVDLLSVLNSSSDDEDTQAQFLGAIYPEAGVHVWLNGRTRLSASASYWVTTVGREHDFWYYGVGLTFGLGAEPRHSAEEGLVREEEYVQRLLNERVRTASSTGEDFGEPEPDETDEPVEPDESLRDSRSSGQGETGLRLPDPPGFDNSSVEPLELPTLKDGALSPARSRSYVDPQD